MKISIIVAFDDNKLIGKDNTLPWHLPADLKYFKNLTMGHHMLMGRKTFDSIGKPLPGRVSVIITRQAGLEYENAIVAHSIEDALAKCQSQEEVFVIGGAEIFKAVMPLVTDLYVTRIHHTFEGDTYFPQISTSDWKIISVENVKADEKNKWDYSFVHYTRK